jgi:hypothetical protein
VLDRFETELRRVRLPEDGDWRAVLRAYAFAFRDGLIQVGAQVGSAVDRTPFRGVGAVAVLALAERVLAALLDAGFDVDDARRGVTAVANIAQSAAQHAVHALSREPADDYPALRRVLAAAPEADAGQFGFELDLAIAGLERRLGGSGA